MGILGSEQLDWLAKDLSGIPASTPVVVFTHVPLYALYPGLGLQQPGRRGPALTLSAADTTT